MDKVYYESHKNYMDRAEKGILELFTEEDRHIICEFLLRGSLLSSHMGDYAGASKAGKIAARFGPTAMEMTPELEQREIKNTIDRIKAKPEWIKEISEKYKIPIPEGWGKG